MERGTRTLAHGYFGQYLHRIGAEATTECKECGDSSQHTLEECPQHQEARRTNAIDKDLSPAAIVGALLGSELQRKAVTFFCEEVMAYKKERERD